MLLCEKKKKMGTSAKLHSSLPLEVLIFFNGWFNVIYIPVTLALLIYKAIEYPFPANVLAREIAYLALLALLEWARLFLGSKVLFP